MTNFTFSLAQSGVLTLRWDCAQPRGAAGTVYHVYRRLVAEGEFAFVGVSGEKRYVDGALPAGTSMVTYQVQAIRSTSAGRETQFVVNLGVNAETVRRRAMEPSFQRAA